MIYVFQYTTFFSFVKKNANFFVWYFKLFAFIVILPMGKDLVRVKVRKKRTFKYLF